MGGEISGQFNVLRRAASMLLNAKWVGGREDAAALCAEQYDRVLTRLKELTPYGVQPFDPPPPGVSHAVTAADFRQLAVCYVDAWGASTA